MYFLSSRKCCLCCSHSLSLQWKSDYQLCVYEIDLDTTLYWEWHSGDKFLDNQHTMACSSPSFLNISQKQIGIVLWVREVFPLKMMSDMHLNFCGTLFLRDLMIPATNVTLFFSFPYLAICTSWSPLLGGVINYEFREDTPNNARYSHETPKTVISVFSYSLLAIIVVELLFLCGYEKMSENLLQSKGWVVPNAKRCLW